MASGEKPAEGLTDHGGGEIPAQWNGASGSRRNSASLSRRDGVGAMGSVGSSILSLSQSVRGSWGLIGMIDNPLERRSVSQREDAMDDEEALRWAAVERLPTYDRVRTSVIQKASGSMKQVDVRDLTPMEKHELLERLMQHEGDSSNDLLVKMRKRLDKYAIPNQAAILYKTIIIRISAGSSDGVCCNESISVLVVAIPLCFVSMV
jgi:hypothetical protein